MQEKEIVQMHDELISLKTEKEVSNFIGKYGQGWVWKPVGGKENAGIIDMGSEPGDALAERITNGIDALVERKFNEQKPAKTPQSPREAVEALFKIPKGDLSKLKDDERRSLAQNLVISFLESGEDKKENPLQWKSVDKSPTVEVKDKGIGQHADKFEKTFLSLNESNKIGKHYLMGAFGQGGSTVYGFGTYSIILSRVPLSLLQPGQEDIIGWVIVRRNERDSEQFKKAIYEYCTSSDEKIMRFPKKIIKYDFEGSLIKLIQFELPQQSTIYTAPAGSLWWLTHHCLFDPVLPFLICDKRKERFQSLTDADACVGKVINGNKFRLNAKDRKTNLPKYKTNYWEINLNDYSQAGKIKVTWWVCENKNDIVNYSTKSEPAVITFNGQRQITISKSDINLKGRDFVKDRLIIHIIGDTLSSSGQRIFSSTRDRAKKNSTYVGIVDRLRKSLIDDEELKELDKELREKTLAKETSAQEQKAKEMLDKLLERQERLDEKANKTLSDDFMLPITTPPRMKSQDEVPRNDEPKIKHIKSNPTLNNVPTKLEILNTENPILVERGYRAILNIFLDAENDYFTRDKNNGEMLIEFEDVNGLMEKARSNLRNGKISVRIEPDRNTEINKVINVKITVTRPDMAPLVKEIKLKIAKAEKRWRLTAGKKKAPTPNSPRLVLVEKNDSAWDTLGWDDRDVAELKDNIVYVSKANVYVEACLKGIKGGEEIVTRYLSRYAAHMALFTILQKKSEDALSASLPDGYRKIEMERAARALINSVVIKLDELDSSF